MWHILVRILEATLSIDSAPFCAVDKQFSWKQFEGFSNQLWFPVILSRCSFIRDDSILKDDLLVNEAALAPTDPRSRMLGTFFPTPERKQNWNDNLFDVYRLK